MTGLTVLAVDDEPPALDELAYLLGADPRVAQVRTASDAVSALQELEGLPVDAVFLDIAMPAGMAMSRKTASTGRPSSSCRALTASEAVRTCATRGSAPSR